MAGQIRMTPESMESQAMRYLTEAENVDSVIRNMDSLLQQLQTEWEGAASQAYAERYGQLKPGFEKARDLIVEIAESLRKSANALRETDQNIANAYRG